MVNLWSAVLALAAVGSASVLKDRAACNADNCLRAVRNTNFPTRGSTDCAAFFRTTVTPATVTLTATATSSVVSTSVVAVTLTSSVQVTATSVVLQTDTKTATTTLAPQFKRAASNTIPAYASPCSGEVRYSSACSCLGATTTTITAAAPSTVITVTKTTTYSTKPLTSTIDTTILSSTQTLTTTSTSEVTTTVTSTPAPISFVMQVYGAGTASNNGQYMKVAPGTGLGFNGWTLTTDLASAQRLIKGKGAQAGQVLDAAGSGSAVLPYSDNSFALLAFGTSSSPELPDHPTPLVCTYAADNAMSCVEPTDMSYMYFGLYGNTGSVTIDKTTGNFQDRNLLQFRAIPV